MQGLQRETPRVVALLRRDSMLHQVLPPSLAGLVSLKGPLPTPKLQVPLRGGGCGDTSPCPCGRRAYGWARGWV